MKRLSDYKDEQLLDLLAEVLEPVATILADGKLKEIYKSEPKIKVAQYVLKSHKSEVLQILKAIDDTPVTFVNIIKRIIDILTDIENDPAISDFFKFAGQETGVNGTFGSAMGNIGDGGV